MGSFKWLKLLLVVVVFLSGGWLGWYLKPIPAAPVAAVSTTTAVATSKSVSTSRTVSTSIKTTKPDGSVIEQKQTVAESVKETESTSRITNASVAPTKKPQYRVGADYLPDFSRKPEWTDAELRAAARVGDSPVWLEGGYDMKHKQAKIGISVEF